VIGSLGVVCFGRSIDEVTHAPLDKWHTARLSSTIYKKCHASSMYLPILVSDAFSHTVNHTPSCTSVWAFTSTHSSTSSVLYTQTLARYLAYLKLPSLRVNTCKSLETLLGSSLPKNTTNTQVRSLISPAMVPPTRDQLSSPRHFNTTTLD
jgi:hypothetical protein